MSNQLLYQIALTLIPGLGPINTKKLIAYCGGCEPIFKESKGKLLKIPSIGPATINNILSAEVLKTAEQEINFIQKHNISPLFFLDKTYPNKLMQCADSPILIYYKGSTQPNQPRIVSIVGARKASNYGKEICEQIVKDLQPYNPIITSGLAYGIDICAHKAALKHNLKTIGVMAHGMDRVYPAQHGAIAKDMLNNGGLLTEFMSGTIPNRENFPKRNRIVAGMADCTLVVEASIKGGALITAHLANDYNRDVFAVPGRLGDLNSEGCNRIIKTHKAHLVESAEDIAYIMGWNKEDSSEPQQTQLFTNLQPEEEAIVDVLRNGELNIDTLSAKCNMNTSKALSLLFTLEMQGVVKSLPGKVYKLL